MDGCARLRAGICVCCSLAGKKYKRCQNWEGCFRDGHTSMLVAAVRPDIRCHPVAVHLLRGIAFIVIFDIRQTSAGKAVALVSWGHYTLPKLLHSELMLLAHSEAFTWHLNSVDVDTFVKE